jgi:hypothetical protein
LGVAAIQKDHGWEEGFVCESGRDVLWEIGIATHGNKVIQEVVLPEKLMENTGSGK